MKNKTYVLGSNEAVSDLCKKKNCFRCKKEVFVSERWKKGMKFICETCMFEIDPNLKNIDVSKNTAEMFGMPKKDVVEIGRFMMKIKRERNAGIAG
jgi:hypothetical protein